MNKNILTVFAAVSALVMVSCGTPSDLRPNAKVSTEYVEPGTRSTYNITDAGTPEIAPGAVQRGEVIHGDDDVLNHDPGGYTIEERDSMQENQEYNQGESIENR